MATAANPSLFRINPTVSALAIAFTAASSAHAAEKAKEEASLPEVKVSSPKDEVASDGYKTERASSSKFTAPLLDTPKSVTVISNDVIKDTGSVSLEDALRTVPGITFGSAEGGGAIGDRPFIRGFDSQASMYVDGIRDVGGQTREIFAIESVEVLKGPSGAFDGRGSAGGSINLVTKQPKSENFISGTVGLGTDQYKRGTADVNYVLTDDVAIRVNAMAHSADTPGRDEVDVKRFGFAPSITFGMNSPTSVNLSYYHLNTDDVPDYGLPFTLAGRSKATPSRPAEVDHDNFYGLTTRDFRKTETDIGTATIKHAFSDDVVLKNVTRFGVSRNDYIVTVPDDSRGNVANGSVYRSVKSRDSKTETVGNVTDLSVKFDTGTFKHSVNTGIEISREETRNNPYVSLQQVLNGNGTNVTTCNAATQASNDCTDLYNPDPNDSWNGQILRSPVITTSKTITKSAYIFDSIELTKQWLVNLGLRYDHYSSDANTPAYQRIVSAGNGPSNAVGATVPAVSLENNSSFWNYQAGVVYKPQPNASIYASYGTSSTPSGNTLGTGSDNLSGGTATVPTAGNQSLDPERSRIYEIGTKWDILTNLSLTGAVFRIEKTNARVTTVTGETELAGDQKVEGFELGFAGKLTNKWQAFGGYTFLDSELVDNGNGISNGVSNSVNNGNRFPNTPKNSASLWTTYSILPNLSVGGGAFYVDEQFGNTANSVEIPSYTRFDAMANYKISKNFNLQLNVQNLTDKRYFNSTYSTHYATVAAGRLAFLTLGFTY